MKQLWQLYDEQGLPLAKQGAPKDVVFDKGLLHGGSHVWIWRLINNSPQVLLQKRSADKLTWPNRYDISAAGHIDLGENPLTAAKRETQEELGFTVKDADLKLISVHRAHLISANGAIENEYQWVYLLRYPAGINLTLQQEEVASVKWKSLEDFTAETRAIDASYLPHGNLYFDTVIAAITYELSSNT